MFLVKVSLRPWKLAPISHVFSGVAVGFLLLLAGFLFWMQAGLKPVLARLQGEQVVTAYLDPNVEGKDETKIVDSIHSSLGAHAERAEIHFVDSHQFVQNLKTAYPDLSRELEDLGPEMTAIVPRYVSVAGVFPDQTLEKIRSVPGIESAETSKDRYAPVVGAFQALRWVARLLIAGVGLALFTGLIHLAKMNAYMHREAIQILKLWGAGQAELRAPGMISGLLVGALGGLIAAVGWLTVGDGLAKQIHILSPLLRDLPPVSVGFAATLFLVGCLVGLLAGALGGVTAADGFGGAAATDAR